MTEKLSIKAYLTCLFNYIIISLIKPPNDGTIMGDIGLYRAPRVRRGMLLVQR
jgi:hypothetical protein